MKKSVFIFVGILILLAMGGCGSFSTPAAGMYDTASPKGTVQTAAGPGASDALIIVSPSPSDLPATEPPKTTNAAEQPTASPTASPAPTASQSVSTPSPTATADAAAGFIQVGPITGTADVQSYLPLRASPSSSSSLLKKIPKDAEFTVIKVAQNAQWLKVSYSGETGYVFAKYVKIGGDTANRVCTVTSGAVNMHTGAGKKYDVLGILENGATVIVTAQAKASSYTWYEVSAGDKKGYICGIYCRLGSS